MSYSRATYQATAIIIYLHFKIKDELYEYCSNRLISEMLNIPAPTVVKLTSKLKSSGILEVREGVKGGNTLAKPIEEITLYDVFDAMEHGNPLFNIHTGFHLNYPNFEGIVEKTNICFAAAEEQMLQTFRSTTIADLAL